MSNIKVEVDYVSLGQAIENCLWAANKLKESLNKLKDKLDVAAIEQGAKNEES